MTMVSTKKPGRRHEWVAKKTLLRIGTELSWKHRWRRLHLLRPKAQEIPTRASGNPPVCLLNFRAIYSQVACRLRLMQSQRHG